MEPSNASALVLMVSAAFSSDASCVTTTEAARLGVLGVAVALANSDESMFCSAVIKLEESAAAATAASALLASVVCPTALTVANRLSPERRLPPLAPVTVMSDSGMLITTANIVRACASVGVGSTTHSEVTSNVVATVEPTPAFIPSRILLPSKSAAFVIPAYFNTDITSIGTGVGAGVGGIGVGASEMGVTSINSVSLVSFILINIVMSTLLLMLMRNCVMSSGPHLPSFAPRARGTKATKMQKKSRTDLIGNISLFPMALRKT